ncbi:MAG TPA: CBS domain-containing protein [Candidatus Deferrimicrobium sp.]|nr:CBS domain-containing protein [Candidatus Deferrimicrobium sp.]
MVPGQTSYKTTYKDIASTNILFCKEDDSVSTVARLMRDNWTDTVFVKDETDNVTGMMTDGIIWNLIAREKDPKDPRTLKAKDVMFRNFIRVSCDEPIESIEKLREILEQTKIQRIGLVRDDKIVGLVRKKFIERVKRYQRNFSFSLK